MQITSPQLLTQFKNLLQTELFPVLESAIGPLSKQGKLLASVLSLEPLSRFVKDRRFPNGRRPSNRLRLATAFFAKAIYNLPTTRHLIERLQSDTPLRRLCGWESAAQVPTESTFSRAFAEFALSGLPAQVHESLVRRTQKECVIDYIARDSTAIEARQTLPGDKDKPRRGKQVCKAKTPRKRGAKKGPHKRSKARHRGPRLQRQQHMTLPEMIADLPQECSLGVKTSSKGHQQYWRGYKLHWDVADSYRIPISCVITGASVHDSQVAIPLMQMSAERVRWKCDVMDSGLPVGVCVANMDSAYYAKAIREQSKKLGHEALVKPPKSCCKNQQAPTPFTDEQKQRFKKRTIVEQLNGRLKDEFGGRIIYFKGAAKIMAHLMFGVVALTVDQLLRLAP
jgi:hypothetical protein